jgi:hypothetical protein
MVLVMKTLLFFTNTEPARVIQIHYDRAGGISIAFLTL